MASALSQSTWILVAIAAAIVCALLFAAIGCAKTSATTDATVRSKSYREPSSYQPYAHGPADRGFRTQSSIAIAASYSLELDADNLGPVRASVNEVAAKSINVGDRVTITYTVRGLPLIWKRVYVLTVEPKAAPALSTP